jgi:hypothetical protein
VETLQKKPIVKQRPKQLCWCLHLKRWYDNSSIFSLQHRPGEERVKGRYDCMCEGCVFTVHRGKKCEAWNYIVPDWKLLTPLLYICQDTGHQISPYVWDLAAVLSIFQQPEFKLAGGGDHLLCHAYTDVSKLKWIKCE